MNTLNLCLFFDILEFNEFSDHAPLSFHIRLASYQESANCREKSNEPEITRKIVWDTEKISDFTLLLKNHNDHILRLTAEATSEPVDDTVKHLSQFLHDKAFEVFGKTFNNSNTSKKHNVNKEWFDENCKNAKRDFTHARNVFNRARNDQSRINFTQARTKYNRVKRKAQYNYKIKEGQRLNDLAKKDPRKFWKTIKKSYKNRA